MGALRRRSVVDRPVDEWLVTAEIERVPRMTLGRESKRLHRNVYAPKQRSNPADARLGVARDGAPAHDDHSTRSQLLSEHSVARGTVARGCGPQIRRSGGAPRKEVREHETTRSLPAGEADAAAHRGVVDAVVCSRRI